MTADVFDRTGMKLFIKVGRARLLGRSRLYTSYRLLLWLKQSGFSNTLFTFPEAVGYFSEKGLSFLALECIDHWDVWSTKTPIEKFMHYSEVIMALQTISSCPSFVEKYDHCTVLETLKRYASYVRRHARIVDDATITDILELFRSNRKLFDRFYGVFSHNDIQGANLLYRRVGEGPRFCLTDFETCRISNKFSDFARCYNREVLAGARARFLKDGNIGDVEFGEAYGAVLKLYNDDKEARKMFDLLILVDSLMHLHWTVKHELGDSREFVERLFSTMNRERLRYF